MTIKNYIQFAFFLLLTAPVFGQGVREELEKMLENYNNLDGFSVDAEYFAYETHGSSEVVDYSVAEFRKDGNKLRTKHQGIEYIQNDKYATVKDDNSKMIVLAGSQKIPENLLGIEQTFSTYEKIEKTGETDKTTSYKIRFKQGSSTYEQAILVVNKSNQFLKQIILYYADQYAVNTEGKPDYKRPKVKIKYKNYKVNPTFPKGEFSTSQYFKGSGKNKKLIEKYDGYSFHDKTI